VDATVTTLKAAFSNTPLEQPVLDVVNCVILMKVEDVQRGLDFVNEHARVTLPQVNESTLGINLPMTALTLSLNADSNGNGSSLAGIVTELVDKWDKAIRQQALVASGLLVAYVCVATMGFFRVMYGLRENLKVRGEGGGTSRGSVQGIAWVRAKIWPYGMTSDTDDKTLEGPGPTPSALEHR
jgi:hypothetical protein